MINLRQLAGGVAAAAIVASFAGQAMAQQTSGSMRGSVVDEAGAAVSGASVTILHTPSGTVAQRTTSGNGTFNAKGLRLGGPYAVTITSPGKATYRIEGISLSLTGTFVVDAVIEGAKVEDTIVVTANALNTANLAIGPSASFDYDDLQTLPAINRDLRDIIRTDPRIYIDESFAGAVQCAGANPRFNSLTVDGVRMNDSFGLNSNGFPTERMPFSFDAIDQVAVELSPTDVEYGGFTACNINAVTRSGSNEIHGGAFFDYTSDDLQGSTLEGQKIAVGNFTEKRYGFNVGAPIIKDKVFAFVSYEKQEGANTFDRGPEGGGFAREIAGLTQADIDEVARIARDVYDYEPGGIPVSAANKDEKILVKLDWNISANHRAALTYNYNNGFNVSRADGDNDEFEFFNHLYERGAKLNSFAGSLYSDWSENFSTELRVSYLDLNNRQIPQGGTDFGEVQIRHTGVNGGRSTIFLGADDSRHANKLNYNTLNIKLKGDYTAGDHVITGGIEKERVDVFNKFIQEAQGEYRFNSIADFAAGNVSRITYENAVTNNSDDAAADWAFSVNTAYLQDEWSGPNGLTLTAGFRFDYFSSGSAPKENPAFVTRHGFSNSETIDGKSLFQPRFGAQWDANDSLTFRAGAALFSGGNPNVWLSNNFSNDGVTQIEVRDGVCQSDGLFAATCNFVADEGGSGRPIYGVPQDLFDSVASGRTGDVNALDPDFKIPREWKFSFGFSKLLDVPFSGVLGGEYDLSADALYARTKNPAVIQQISFSQVGTGPLGMPIYTNGRPADFLLTNSRGAGSTNLSFTLSKDYDNGLDWTLGYAYSDANDVNPMTSSVAFSNFNNVASVDANNLTSASSNYNIPHRVTLRASYKKAFFGDNMSKFSVFASKNQGRPFSFTFEGNSLTNFNPFQGSDSTLLYVPTGPGDALVQFGPSFDQAAFFAFLDEHDLNKFAGGFAPRNSFNSDWWTKVDLRFEQDFPGFREADRVSAFIVMENVGNFIDSDWGILKQAGFPRMTDVVDADFSANGSQFIFNEFTGNNPQGRVGRASLWKIRIGARYNF